MRCRQTRHLVLIIMDLLWLRVIMDLMQVFADRQKLFLYPPDKTTMKQFIIVEDQETHLLATDHPIIHVPPTIIHRLSLLLINQDPLRRQRDHLIIPGHQMITPLHLILHLTLLEAVVVIQAGVQEDILQAAGVVLAVEAEVDVK